MSVQVNSCIIEGTTSVMSTASTEKARLARVILQVTTRMRTIPVQLPG